ncbi:unnamed protein product [Cuscuta campestris]|uniref:At4g15545-like C-terminal domain-containing protein n=1 Tax=Cuscuta campestris TaxID=132261 RepID=A0A484MS84_9ASTE|nr:unnamed protein product [Cuscuta campestris]
MSQSSGDSGRGVASGGDFYLPDEVLSVIPTNPYEQLDLARKITSMAIASRVTKLESEVGRLRGMVHEKDRAIAELEDKVSNLEQAYQESEMRSKITREDNMKLLKERDTLTLTAKKLGRDLEKLDTFKRQLMQSLSEDNSTLSEAVDVGTRDQIAAKANPPKGNAANGYTTQYALNGSKENAGIADDASKQALQRFAVTPYITPRLTPTGTPKVASASVSPRRYSAAESPHIPSGTTSPTSFQYEGRGSMSSYFPSSQQSSAANSPPRSRPISGQTPRIDGKEFFRQARSRLSYEQFSAFLANIKELNAHKQSREETLRKAEEIFGKDNKDLYMLFQGLLNRNSR